MTKALEVVVEFNKRTESLQSGRPCHAPHRLACVRYVNFSQALGSRSLMESDSRRFSLSMLVITASISWPFFSTSLGCLILRDQEISGNMHQTIDSVFNFDEGSEVGEIPDSTMNASTNLVTFMQRLPRILLHLLHPETDSACLSDRRSSTSTSTAVTWIDDFARMLDALSTSSFPKREPDLPLHFQVPQKRRSRQRSRLVR